MGRLLVFFFLGLVATGLHAQEFSSQVFHDGYLVTTDGDTLRGALKYDMETNIVQMQEHRLVKTYSSHKIFYFEIFDKIVGNYRQFYSIPYNVNYDYQVPILFEVLYEGPVSLLSREAIVQQTVSSNASYWGGGSYVRNIVSYTFYFLDKEGHIDMYTGKKAQLYHIMSKQESKVKDFIKQNHLNVDDVRDLIRITAFYNSL